MGIIECIFTAPREGQAMLAHDAVRVVPGRGIEGDRYFEKLGTFSKKECVGREITFIEGEVLDAIARDYQIALGAHETRRNVITRGVSLNHWVGMTFEVNEVQFKGIELCEPCAYLEKLSEKPGVRKALIHRGGLRAQVLSEGTIQVGQVIALRPSGS